ncbi:Oxidoreductase, short-chain dehydrogenase/reductase family [Rubrivivax sp. A210]|uniref:SDR family NAD(P)-dependent oxidoreductase n=1 Tax=Rubrivivax sp. A210 TaxID=2772301 RepID=UPI001917DD23|nr:SDR family NAD(P)-dependent oxidoreductase [Rubrivivax sp. A210]CAD5367031.1 Oxidoreductase, short-chain dehydrogenase/reductase family [Rubrivivax sp. A210]
MALNPRIDTWAGRLAWIVGASTGIGRATALALHRRGARVAVSARDADALQRLARGCPGMVVLPLDVSDREAVAAASRELIANQGLPDLAFACAGHYLPQRATAFSLAEMKRHMDINYGGPLHLLDVLLPDMLAAGRGHLSLMGSVAAYRGLPQALAYGPTKAALNNLAEVLYLDLHERGLGVSIVNPGFVQTPLTAQNRFPMPALMTPEAAAEAIVGGWSAGRFEIHFPRRFTWGLKALQHLPHGLYFAAVRRATGL